MRQKLLIHRHYPFLVRRRGLCPSRYPPNAVPEQTGGKDYAGRPVAKSRFPLRRRFPQASSSSSSRMSKTSISTSTGLICVPKIAQSRPATPSG